MSIRRSRSRKALNLESLEDRTVLSHVSTIGHALTHVSRAHAAAHVAKVTHTPAVKTTHQSVISVRIDKSPDSPSSGKIDSTSPDPSSADPSSPDPSSPDPKGNR
jgi:hypothetical protein